MTGGRDQNIAGGEKRGGKRSPSSVDPAAAALGIQGGGDVLNSDLNLGTGAGADPVAKSAQSSGEGVRAVVGKIVGDVSAVRAARIASKLEEKTTRRQIQQQHQDQPAKNRIKPQTLAGMPDLLPHQARAMNRLTTIIGSVYSRLGSTLRAQPIMESVETIEQAKRAQGFEGEGLSDTQRYRFSARSTGSTGEDWFALRVDLTLGLARYIAQHVNEITIPFKTHMIGTVFRGERPQKGRLRAFDQADVDYIGTHELYADADVISTLYTALKESIPNVKFTIKINHRSVINGFLEALDIPREKHIKVLRAIDKLDDEESMIRQLTIDPDKDTPSQEPAIGLTQEQAEILIKFLKPNFCKTLSPLELLEGVEELAQQNEEIGKGLDALREIAQYLRAMGVDDENVRIDFSIIRGLDYYSGSVFEIIMDDVPEIGSIGGGGRYDHLTGAYMDTPIPGVGGSLGVSRIQAGLTELDSRRWKAAFPELEKLNDEQILRRIGEWKKDRKNTDRIAKITELEGQDHIKKNFAAADALIIRYQDADKLEVAALMANLRRQGVNVIIHPDAMGERALTPNEQFAYATKNNIPFLIFCGGNELAQGTVSVKDGLTREQNSYTSVEDAAEAILGQLKARELFN